MNEDPYPNDKSINKAIEVLTYGDLERISNLTYIAQDSLEMYARNLDMAYTINEPTLEKLSEAHDVIFG
ncbi:hypothetical protein [Lactobacillus sp. LL6]|uniref:hypothetical protein n=1 Tax=Lactobacillus sp. LL6 TaxID=2596827 RepID=UPI001184CDE2|nr:hypothetical protein [Lactobacillus sp. LL6]TSO26185.1 hypothetical protein FOD82_03690 [Lactobacillus sp. LL6]